VQRIATLEKIASHDFQEWLTAKNRGGFDLKWTNGCLRKHSRQSEIALQTIVSGIGGLERESFRFNFRFADYTAKRFWSPKGRRLSALRRRVPPLAEHHWIVTA
jgi:hypothetical protein